MRSIPRYEQETIIRWAADETLATISTSNPVVIRKLDKLTEAAPDDYKKRCELDDNHDARYTMNVGLLKFRMVSEAMRAANRARSRFVNSERENTADWPISQTSSAPVDSLPTPHTNPDEMPTISGAKRAESKDGEGARV